MYNSNLARLGKIPRKLLRLRRELNRRGITLTMVGERAGVTISMVSLVFKGQAVSAKVLVAAHQMLADRSEPVRRVTDEQQASRENGIARREVDPLHSDGVGVGECISA